MKKNATYATIAICILLLSIKSWAKTYYVSTTGNDTNTGTLASPWRTVQYGANTIIAKDTVYIKAGTYNERVIIKNSGTSNSSIIISAFSGDEKKVIIDGTGISIPTDNGLFSLNTKSYITIIGLRIINSKDAGIYIYNSNHIEIKNCSFYKTYSSGLGVWNSSSILFQDSDVELACNFPIGGKSAIQECVTFSNVENFEVKNNTVHNNPGGWQGGEGIDAKEACKNGKIYQNTIYDFPQDVAIYIDAYDSQNSSIEIYNNKIYNCNTGVALSTEGTGVLENISVYNNIIYNNLLYGIVISNWEKNGIRKNIKINNNTIYKNGYKDPNWGGGIYVETENIENIEIYNNIANKNSAWQIASNTSKTSISYNLIYKFRGYAWTKELKGANVIESDPLFVDTVKYDFHLVSTSPAINSGTKTNAPTIDFDNISRLQKMNICIGAFEYNEGLTTWNPFLTPISESIHIFPNPFYQSIYIEGAAYSEFEVKVHDATGKLISTQTVKSDQEINMSTPLYPSGIYIIKISIPNGKNFYKTIIKK